MLSDDWHEMYPRVELELYLCNQIEKKRLRAELGLKEILSTLELKWNLKRKDASINL